MVAKNIQMTERNAANTDWDDLNPITVAANITVADAGGLLAATNVEDALAELFTNASNGKTAIASAVTGMGVAASGSDTFAQLATKITDISDDANADVAQILTGYSGYSGGTKKIGVMANRGAVTITPTTANQFISAGYHNGAGMVVGDADLAAGNIKNGVNIFNVIGTFANDATAAASDLLAGKTAYSGANKFTGTRPYYGPGSRPVSPTFWTGGGTTLHQYLPAGGGAWDSDVTVSTNFPNLIPSNIASGVDVCGVIGTLSARKCASGITGSTGWATNMGFYELQVSGLPFTPAYVGAAATTPSNQAYTNIQTGMLYVANVGTYSSFFSPFIPSTGYSNPTIFAGGFYIENGVGATFSWFAMEA